MTFSQVCLLLGVIQRRRQNLMTATSLSYVDRGHKSTIKEHGEVFAIHVKLRQTVIHSEHDSCCKVSCDLQKS